MFKKYLKFRISYMKNENDDEVTILKNNESEEAAQKDDQIAEGDNKAGQE